MMRMVVVLPAPFGPRKPRISPGAARERDVLDRGEVAVPLAQVRDFDHVSELDAATGAEIRARYLAIGSVEVKIRAMPRPRAVASRGRDRPCRIARCMSRRPGTPRLHLIDGSGYVYRAFHALPR